MSATILRAVCICVVGMFISDRAVLASESLNHSNAPSRKATSSHGSADNVMRSAEEYDWARMEERLRVADEIIKHQDQVIQKLMSNNQVLMSTNRGLQLRLEKAISDRDQAILAKLTAEQELNRLTQKVLEQKVETKEMRAMPPKPADVVPETRLAEAFVQPATTYVPTTRQIWAYCRTHRKYHWMTVSN